MNANNPMSPEISILMLEDDPSDAKLIEMALPVIVNVVVASMVKSYSGLCSE